MVWFEYANIIVIFELHKLLTLTDKSSVLFGKKVKELKFSVRVLFSIFSEHGIIYFISYKRTGIKRN